MGNRPCKALVSYEEACKRLPLDAFRRIQDMFASFTGRRCAPRYLHAAASRAVLPGPTARR